METAEVQPRFCWALARRDWAGEWFLLSGTYDTQREAIAAWDFCQGRWSYANMRRKGEVRAVRVVVSVTLIGAIKLANTGSQGRGRHAER
jgi:hypothetical protein